MSGVGASSLKRNPSIKKKKLPEVRQTLASKYRILKANPLLMYEMEKKFGINRFLETPGKTLRTIATALDDSSFAGGTLNGLSHNGPKSEFKAPISKPRVEIIANSGSSSTVSHPNDFSTRQLLSSTLIEKKGAPAASNSRSVRRSVSAEGLNQKKVTFNETSTQSLKGEKTPTRPKRSYIATPLDPSKSSPNQLSRRLSDWLQRRGKNLSEYHHLRCFGIHHNNKSKVEVDKTDNKENLLLNNVQPDVVELESVAKEALVDLYKLILEGYCLEQCEKWLRLIRDKCRLLEEQSQYWECRAALAQSEGNISLAVECYKTAIVQGAEVNVVEKSLDQLLQKFSLLNIGQAIDTDSAANKERAKIVQDARNVFKSSIIQFAVQKRLLKKKGEDGAAVEKQLVATPVRRSTRLSRSGYISTPGVKLFSSMHEAEDSLKDVINFRRNKALQD